DRDAPSRNVRHRVRVSLSLRDPSFLACLHARVVLKLGRRAPGRELTRLGSTWRWTIAAASDRGARAFRAGTRTRPAIASAICVAFPTGAAPRVEAPNRDDAKFCGACGVRLAGDVVGVARPAPSVPSPRPDAVVVGAS